jgi:hypothetical protein
MRFLNDMVENGELEVDHCPGKFITPDAITKNTPEAVRKVHADTMHNGHILPPDYNQSNREDANIVLEVRDNFMRPADRGNDPTVDNDEKRIESMVNVDVMGTDGCTMGTDSFRYPHLL